MDVSGLSLGELGRLPDTVLSHVLHDVRRPSTEN
ncbi:FxSxx-COOH cyclophane-containing RiPP peptide [Streptomyces sp. NPDC005481]